jgi:DNA-binding NarL/FixJ family response regulator
VKSSKLRILIADNSAVIRERLTQMLSELRGIEVVAQAQDGQEATNLARKTKPDVAILDLRMPKGNGVDVLTAIKKFHPAPTVIMLTNYAYPENRKQCIDKGADYFFDKSTEFQKVVSVLNVMTSREA